MSASAKETKPVRILLVEDNAGDARLIKESLKEAEDVQIELGHVTHLQDGIRHLAEHETDVVLLDLSLPDSPGLETLKQMQEQAPTVPVIVLTGFDNEEMALAAVGAGAQDYLIKGQIEGRALCRIVLYSIERNRSQSNLRSLSLTDELTQLYNRRGFMDLAPQALKSAERAKSGLVLFYFDLDHLKQINDTYGHPDGDQALAAAAQVLKKTFRKADIVARVGGDEFAVLAAEDQAGGADIFVSRLKGNLAQYNLQNPQAYKISFSIGVAPFDPTHPIPLLELMALADKALYVNKDSRSRWAFFAQDKNRQDRLWIAALLLLLLMLGLWYGLWWMRLHRPTIIPPFVVAVHKLKAPEIMKTVIQKVHATIPVVVAPTPEQKAVPVQHDNTPAWRSTTPPPLNLHRELIPKDITIARFTFERFVLTPGESMGFDITGSGFTEQFQKVLSVYSGSAHVQVRNLHLVTVNQLHGDMVTHPDAPSQYVFPHILIQDTPVFQSATPFCIIRKGEGLNIVFTQMDADGRGGRFRLYTNLDDTLYQGLDIRSNMTGINVSSLRFKRPYSVEGAVRIAPEVPRGDYSLIANLNGNEIYRKEHLIQVIHPTVGQNGFIQSLSSPNKFYRPGDRLEVDINGRGFEEADATTLQMHITGIGDFPVAFVSENQLKVETVMPSDVSGGVYDATVMQNLETVFPGRKVFTIVDPNWIRRLEVDPTAHAGQSSTLWIHGRGFDTSFARSLRIVSEDPGLHVSKPIWIDEGMLKADIELDASVAPGNYWLKILDDGHVVTPAEVAIIQVAQ